MNLIQVPCADCGKLITLDEKLKLTQNFCNEYCKNRTQVQAKRNGVRVTRKKGGKFECRGCGVKKFTN